MAEERLESSEFLDKSGILKDFEDVEKGINQLAKAAGDMQTVIAAGLEIIASKQNELKNAVSAAQNELNDLAASGKINRETLNKLSSEIQKNAKEYKEQAKAAKGAKDSLDIVEGSVEALEKEYKELTKESKKVNLETEEGKKKFKDLTAQTAKLKQEVKDYNAQIRGTASKMKAAVGSYNELIARNKELSKVIKNAGNAFDGTNEDLAKLQKEYRENTKLLTQFDKKLGQNFRNVGNYQGALQNVAGKFAVMSAQITAAILVFEGLKEVLNGSGRELIAARNQVELLANVGEEKAGEMTARFAALERVLGVDLNDSLAAVNATTKQLGGDFEANTDVITTALEGVSEFNRGELVDIFREYGAQAKAAGLSVEQFAAISVRSLNEGVFSDKGIDAVKEFNLRISEQTTATKDALINAFGNEFTSGIFEGINNGSLTTIQALEMISQKMNDTSIPANKLQTVIADVFGGAGEDAGLGFIRSLVDVDQNLEDVIDTSSKAFMANQERVKLQEDLAKAQLEVAETLEPYLVQLDRLQVIVLTLIQQGLQVLLTLFQGFPSVLYQNAEIITGLTTAYLVYNAALIQTRVQSALVVAQEKIKFAIQKGGAVVTAALSAAQAAYGTVSAILAGQISLASAAQAAFNVVMTANPIGIIITLVGGLVIGFIALYKQAGSVSAVFNGLWELTKQLATALFKLHTFDFEGFAKDITSLGEAYQKGVDDVKKANAAREKLEMQREKKQKESNKKQIEEEKKKNEVIRKGDLQLTNDQQRLADQRQKKALELAQREKEAAMELEKFKLEEKLKANERLLENQENFSKDTLAVSEQLQKSLAEIERDEALRDAQTNSERLLIREQYAARVLEIERETKDRLDKFNQDKAKEDEKRLKDEFDATASLARQRIEQQIKENQDILAGQEIKDESLLKETADLQLFLLRLDEERALAGAKTADDRLRIEEDYAARVKQINQGLANDLDENDEKRKQKELERAEFFKERLKELFSEIGDLGLSIFENSTEKRIEGYEAQKEELDENLQNELSLYEDNEQKQAFLRKEAAKKQEALDKQIEKQKRKRAIVDFLFNKGVEIGKAVAATARAVTAALPNIPLSLVVGALGAAQVAKIVSTGLPKFRKGTNRIKGQGRENEDNIMAMVSVNERIMTSEQNREIGFDVSNKELVKRSKFYKKYKDLYEGQQAELERMRILHSKSAYIDDSRMYEALANSKDKVVQKLLREQLRTQKKEVQNTSAIYEELSKLRQDRGKPKYSM